MTLSIKDFKPPLHLRPAMMQTFLASLKIRKRGTHNMERVGEPHILESQDGVKLLGTLSRNDDNKGLFIFLHGWEGSQNSTYVMSCGRRLYEKGYSIFRLNFRDHGDTHHLNPEPFNAYRFNEVFEAVEQATQFAEDTPVYLVGFSLGGNFALRILRESKTRPISLNHIFAISPVVDPWSASPMVDDNPLIARYFFKKWATSMRKKEAAFPGTINTDLIDECKSVMALSKAFVPVHTSFDTIKDYFSSYGLDDDDLMGTHIPTSMIMSRDDPVVPAKDLAPLNVPETVTTIMTEYGGHNGFFQSLLGPTWYDDYISAIISAKA